MSAITARESRNMPSFMQRILCFIAASLLAPSLTCAVENAAPAFAPLIAESTRRVEAAERRLQDARQRRDELQSARDELTARINTIALGMGIERDEAYAALTRRLAEAGDEARRLDVALRATSPENFDQLPLMIEFDRATDQRKAIDTQIIELERQILQHVEAFVASNGQAQPLVTARRQLEIDFIAAGHQASMLQMTRDAVSRTERGAMKYAAVQPDVEVDRTMRLDIRPPADSAQRLQRFASRRSAEAIDALGRAFFSGMTLSLPGLERVRDQVEAHRYGEALEAYKAYFFERLLREAEPERQDGEAVNAMALLTPPTRRELDDVLRGLIVQTLQDRGQKIRIEAQLGPPGAMNWTFLESIAPSPSPDETLQLAYCRRLGDPRAVGRPLLASYAIGGPVEHLHGWCDMVDDWAMNWRRDVEASPLPIRDYNLLIVCRIQALRSQLRMMAIMRPSFVDDLPADTLARLLMAFNEEYLASAVRLGRAGLYNFRIMALMSMLPTSLRMQEFHAHQWALREGWRQVDDNFVYKIRRDGANFEFANDGHENTDQFLFDTFDELRARHAQPGWLDPWWDEEFVDRFKTNVRYRMHNLKPDGVSYRLNARSQYFRYAGDKPEYRVDLLADEAEVRRRLWRVFRIGRPESEPQIASESLAFQGYYYLRSGWRPDDLFVYFQSIGQPILSGREDDTGLSLYGHGGIHLLAAAPLVDDKAQYIHEGLVYWPGGKAPFSTYGRPDTVQEGRFHAGARFDLAEGEFRGVYRYRKPDASFNVFGEYGHESAETRARSRAEREGRPFEDAPVDDVRQSRQVLSVRGRKTYIVTDFYDSRRPHRFAQDYTIYTPTRRDHLAARLRLLNQAGVAPLSLDVESRTLATCNVGLPNQFMAHASALPLNYKVQADPRIQAAMETGDDPAALDKKFGKYDRQEGEMSGRRQFSSRVAMTWQAEGPAALITIVMPQDTAYETTPSHPLADLHIDAPRQDVAAFTARYPDGTPIAYAAAHGARELQAGPVRANARGLLLVGDDGIALDCTAIAIGDQRITPEHADFTFRIEAGRVVIDEPIYRPIQPVVIEPACNIFVGEQQVTLRCETPDVEIRYTLDGSRPTPASPLYAEPIRIGHSCRIKARAFRKGTVEDIWQQDGTHATVEYDAVFVRTDLMPALAPGASEPGLGYQYFTGVWTDVMTNARIAPTEKSGVSALLDTSMRDTAGAFGVRYEGYIDVPRDGVYTFHAPRELVYPDRDSGYDLRLFIDDREWYPAVRWHAHGTWSIALAKGRHRFRAIFADLRPRPHKVELMWGFPHPDFTWKGAAPIVEISGPGLDRQPIPSSMLSH
jgi:hypothetical protein